MGAQNTALELPELPAYAAYRHEPRNAAGFHVFESFADLPATWHEICGKEDLGMDPKVLRVFERTLKEQCRCWGVMVFDRQGVAIGCAALCLFSVELIESGHPAFLRLRDRLRCTWPGFNRMKVLFCGLPVPSGSSHLRVREGVPADIVVEEVHRAMEQIARAQHARLMVFKEWEDDALAVRRALGAQGYSRGDIPPLHVLSGGFKDFAAYCDALKSRYRAQVRRSQKLLESSGFEVLTGRGAAFCLEHFDEHVHGLYVAMQAKARQKLELMPLSFFREMAAELGDEVSLTFIHREGRVCAFTFAVTRGDIHYNLYSGLDYALNDEGQLYFNLFYNDLDQAFKAGAQSVHLGQTSDSFKSRLGTEAMKLSFFARPLSPVFAGALRVFSRLVFPKVEPAVPNDVFV